MTVRELIKQLSALPNKNAEIVMSSDPEGNYFYSVEEIGGKDDSPIIWPGVEVEPDDEDEDEDADD